MLSNDYLQFLKQKYSMSDEVVALIKKWGYDPDRAREFAGHDDECTLKQSAYIRALQDKHPEIASELEIIVNCKRPDGTVALESCTKGQAMWVITILQDPHKYLAWISRAVARESDG